jgi:hypothetical protein
LFKNLGHQLTQVSDEIYPLHPIMAAGLFGLSALAQATRTALTFFRDNLFLVYFYSWCIPRFQQTHLFVIFPIENEHWF